MGGGCREHHGGGLQGWTGLKDHQLGSGQAFQAEGTKLARALRPGPLGGPG